MRDQQARVREGELSSENRWALCSSGVAPQQSRSSGEDAGVAGAEKNPHQTQQAVGADARSHLC